MAIIKSPQGSTVIFFIQNIISFQAETEGKKKHGSQREPEKKKKKKNTIRRTTLKRIILEPTRTFKPRKGL